MKPRQRGDVCEAIQRQVRGWVVVDVAQNAHQAVFVALHHSFLVTSQALAQADVTNLAEFMAIAALVIGPLQLPLVKVI
ncbi:hypothetical protein [Shimia sp. W99]